MARSTLDCSRTIFVWATELFLGWAAFKPMQLAGFTLLALGTLIYNDVFNNILPAWLTPPKEESSDLSESLCGEDKHVTPSTWELGQLVGTGCTGLGRGGCTRECGIASFHSLP